MEASVNPHTNKHADPQSNPAVAHERTDADSRAVTKFGIGLVFIVMASYLFLWWLFDHFSAREASLSPPVPALIRQQAAHEPPEPRLQMSPPVDMRKMRQDEDAVLHHYGWVDPDRGVVRIPIERAIDIIAGRGLPRFEPETGKGPEAKRQAAK